MSEDSRRAPAARRSATSRFARGLVGLVALLSISACIRWAWDDLGAGDGGTADAAPAVDADGARDASRCDPPPPPDGEPEGCVLARPPGRLPAVCDTDDREAEARVIERGFRSIRFRPEDGYDLDGVCTTSIGSPVSCTVDPEQLDILDTTPGGTDNSFASTIVRFIELTELDALLGFESRIDGALRRGYGVPMVRISGWNGTPNDSRVDVEIALSAEPADGAPVRWDATPTLIPSEAFYGSTSGLALARDANAYVSNGVLVARIADGQLFEWVFDSRVLAVRLYDLRATMTMAAGGPVDLTIQGRWRLADGLDAIAAVLPCESESGARTAAQNGLRIALDVAGSADDDRLGLACSAVSVVTHFAQPEPIRWGEPGGLAITPSCD